MRTSVQAFAYYAADFFRIWCITQTRIAEFVRVGFEVAHVEVEERQRQTEMMFAIIGLSATCAAVSVAANIRSGCKTEERLFGILSPPFLFFLMSLFSGPKTMSLGSFVGLTTFSWTASYFLSPKITSVPESQPLLILPADLKRMDLPVYPAATRVERALNTARLIQMSVFAFAAVSTLLAREFAGETKQLAFWNYEILALVSVIPGFVGYHLTDDPKFARGFAALPVCFFEDISFIYATLSAWFSLALLPETIEAHRMLCIHVCAYVTVATSLFSAAKTDFDPEKIHQNNVRLIEGVKQIPDFLDEKRRLAGEACKDFGKLLSRYRDSFVNVLPNPRKWCADDEPVGELQSLV